MRACSPLLLAIATLVAASHAPVSAQTTAPKPATPATQPTKEQIDDAAFQMRVLVGAMNSDKVEAPVKDALFQCLYQNSFSKISEGIAKVIAANPGKINKREPEQVLGVMAGICGYRPKPTDAAATPAPAAPAKPAPTPAKPGAKPQGR
ncbi:MAG: hypothetical protein J7485_11065 [Sphingobium sp.]|nr:hypothetical protein [Sphingobium sp.]